MRTQPSSNRLTFTDAVDIWPRIWGGEYQNRIAADYDVNPGRINEIAKERRHIGSKEAALAKLRKDLLS